jgi:protein-S-isoprenylcysteine O-methyltransferase Ste14
MLPYSRHVKRMPPAAGVLIWVLGAVAMHAVVPSELSRLGNRGDRNGRTRPVARCMGLLTVAAGATLMAWALAAHYQAAPRGWVLEWRRSPKQLLRSPPYQMEYLLQRGPYRQSRNPMYIGEAVVWLGWALFYDSWPVWAGWVMMCVAFAKIVRWEERRLLERFGDDYRAYLAAVPRWVGVGRKVGEQAEVLRRRSHLM